MKLLIADDSAVTRRMLREAVTDWEYEVVEAANGNEAWDILQAEDAPRLAILDWLMPGTDGPEICRRLREVGQERYTYLVLLTSQSEREHIIEGLQSGADDYLVKPCDTGELEQRLRAGARIIELQDRLLDANKKLARDLEVAARVQQAQLPAKSPQFDNCEIAWAYKPCDELGGDFLNVFQLDDNHLGLYLLDVTGHGVPAALVSVAVSRALQPSQFDTCIVSKPVRSQDARVESLNLTSPAGVAEILNRRFPTDGSMGQFFSLVYCVLNPSTGWLHLVSAGHPPPVFVRNSNKPGYVDVLNGPPIGVLQPDDHGYRPYEEYSLDLRAGDRLFLYSDGLTEAFDTRERQFGEHELLQSLEYNAFESLDELVVRLVNEVEDWSGTERVQDDISVLAIELKG